MEPTPPASPPVRRPIPRPDIHRPGSPAPWATLTDDRRRGITLARVQEAVDGGRGPTPDGPEPWPTDAIRAAAVLVALFEEGGESRVILTVRSDDLPSHRGEVAFPGGRLEAGEGVVEAALREATEEVALAPDLVTVIGQLTATPTVASNTIMTPVVATLEGRPTLVASPAEVVRIFDVALADLLADGIFHEERWTVPGRPGASGLPDGEFPVWFFEVAAETVWGATARTLMELLCLIVGVPLPASLPASLRPR